MAQIGSEREIAERYVWLITHGVFRPVFNDPKVIDGSATPHYVDRLIREDIRRWSREVDTGLPPLAA